MKRLFVLFLTVVMLIGYVPVHANAVDEPIVQTEILALEETAEISVETMTISVDPGLPDNEELFAAYAQQELYGYGVSTFGVAAGARLDSNEKLIYDALVPVIKRIANGKRVSTCIGLGETVELSDGTVFPGDVDVDFAGVTVSTANLQNIMTALLCDFPYEMYWYDKVTGIGCSIIRSNRILNVYITFAVSDNYSADGNMYAVNTKKTGATVTVAANAKKIVNKHASKTDYKKLAAYRDEICKLVSYNKSASLSGNFSQDNAPWQLMYVFDGDDSTTVVCEGYSKAFMYLCDLSEFSKDIVCYTVSGTMNTERHMWNIVSIDGASYLVDITNSDTGTIGADGRFFLAGTAGSPEKGYTIKGTTYCYDALTLSFWGADDDSILNIEEKDCPFSASDEHEFSDWVVTVEPTCTETGLERKECKKCGYFETKILDAIGHNYAVTITAPTCTEQGYTIHTCTCGDSYIDSYVDAVGHSWTVGVITKEPTEEETGIKTYNCTACEETKTEEIPTLEHTHIYADAVTNPTCTEMGYTTYTCACGDSYTDNYVDPVDHSWDAGVVTKEPTETETGIKTYTCTVCAEIKTEELPTVGHVHSYASVVTAPTCTEKGYTTHTCTCGDKYVDSYVDPIDHSWDAGVVTKEPTETDTGIKTYTCTVCAEIKTEELPTIGHVHTYTSVVTAPTCTEKGYITHTCICGDSYEDTYVDPTGHIGAEIKDAVEATCTDAGYSGDTYCMTCGTKLATGREIPAKGHNYIPTTVEPTYTKSGYVGIICEYCHDVQDAEEIAPTGLPDPVVKGSNDPTTGGALLNWEADGEADYYEVYRATSAKGKYTKIDTVTDAEAIVKIPVGKSHYFKIKAICEENASLSSDYSKYVKVTGKCAQPNVTVTTNTSGKPVLKWGKVTSAKKYYIYRSEEGGKETKIATVTKTTYTDSKAKPGKTYTYRVRAYGSKSSYTGAYSEGVVCLAKCAQPVITVKINAATGKPDITWKTISGATDYLIQRKVAGEEKFKDIQIVTALKYADLEAPVDTDVEYRVIAQSPENAYDSVPSAIKKTHTTLAKPVVTFKVDDVTGKPTLSWEAVEGAVEYKIYRSTKSTSSYKAVKTTTETEYTDTSASVGKGYYYKVIAIGANTKSAYSSYKKLTAKCAQPVITVEINADGKPVIEWSKISGAKKYYVYRIDENGKQTSLGSTTKISYTDKKATEGVTYTYCIRAYGSKSSYNSIYSENVACVWKYVVNTNTGKFHYPSCSSADDIAVGNRWEYEGMRDDLIDQGYIPCKKCDP